ncbi:probable cytochrome P450 4aa1 [Schistocerca piceifrons]|uniref:probable cytochrome P450 4aa1 n=2 Tax=Schistocerca TaxID=7008 RepID=UPI001F5FB52C|nr:probable cytochrome P450 4aa1 [Schistocerca piceifrons]
MNIGGAAAAGNSAALEASQPAAPGRPRVRVAWQSPPTAAAPAAISRRRAGGRAVAPQLAAPPPPPPPPLRPVLSAESPPARLPACLLVVMAAVLHAADWVAVAWDAALCLALLAAVAWLSTWARLVWIAARLPGPPALPFLGNALLLTQHEVLQDLGRTAHRMWGSIFRIWAPFFMPMIVIIEPEHVEAVLKSQRHTEKISYYRLLHNFIGDGLITSSGKKWRNHRLLLQPAFHMSVLENFVETFSSSAQALVSRLASKMGDVNVAPDVNHCVIDILNEAVMGIPVPKTPQQDAAREASPFRKGEVLMPQRVLKPWLLLSFVYRMTDLAQRELQQKRALDNFAAKILQERKLKRLKATESAVNGETDNENGSWKQRCLLDLMLDIANKTNGAFTDQDIVSELCTFMLAGQDSVGAAVAFCTFLLAQNPECQERAMEELRAIFYEGGSDCGRPPTREDLSRMKYLDQCVREALRLFPSVPLIARRLGDDLVIGKHTLPAGTDVLLAPYAMHRLEHVFPDPEAFDPDRFTADNCSRRHPYSYIPFSAGPRNCIGYKFAMMEMKVVMSTLLRHFRLEPVKGRESLRLAYRITIRARGGIWVHLSPRTPVAAAAAAAS